MAANVEAMVREGESALRAGRKDEARALLMKAVEIDQFNEEAWLWLSAVVETPEDQQTCLENVLAINPNNARAREGLNYLKQDQGGESVSSPPLVSPPPAPPPLAAPASSPSRGEIATSVEWAAPEPESQPAPSARKGLELSEEDYDDWVSTLNLPTNSKPPTGAQPFVADEDEIEDEPDFNLFPAAAPLASPPPMPSPQAKPQKMVEAEAEPVVKERPAKVAAPQPAYEPLFPEIPDEVRVTRLPGTNQRIPILLIVLLLLIVLNLGAGVLLARTLLAP